MRRGGRGGGVPDDTNVSLIIISYSEFLGRKDGIWDILESKKILISNVKSSFLQSTSDKFVVEICRAQVEGPNFHIVVIFCADFYAKHRYKPLLHSGYCSRLINCLSQTDLSYIHTCCWVSFLLFSARTSFTKFFENRFRNLLIPVSAPPPGTDSQQCGGGGLSRTEISPSFQESNS
jgi:hypothetical protein